MGDESREDAFRAVKKSMEGIAYEGETSGEQASYNFGDKHEEGETCESEVPQAFRSAGTYSGFLIPASVDVSVWHERLLWLRVVKKQFHRVWRKKPLSSIFLLSRGFFDMMSIVPSKHVLGL